MTTAPLYMIQLTPDPLRFGPWVAAQRLADRSADDGYGWHALLKAAFGELAPKPFRLIERPNRPLQLLGYATADEASLHRHASAFADPAVTAALRLDTLAVKRMPNRFPAGHRLCFDVRIRPTVRQHVNGDRATSRERDAFLAAVEKAGPRQSRADLDRQTVYADWLRRHLEAGGARLLKDVCAVALRRTRVSRRERERGLKAFEGPDAIFTGTLEVAAPAIFQQLLARGVGRHRSFGFGMLLLRPPGKG